MKLHSTFLAACASLALAATGCLVGEVDDPGTGTDPGPGIGTDPGTDPGVDPGTPGGPIDTTDPVALFNTDVFPAVQATCDPGGACHTGQAPAFVGPDAASTYTLMNNSRDLLFPNYEIANAKIVTYGTGGAHKGISYSPQQLQAVQAWLAAEAAQPVDNAPSPLAVWSGCMDLQDWQNTGVADAWADKGSGDGDCDACHNLGAENFIASNVDQRVFDAVTTDPGFMISYFATDANGQVIINRDRFVKVGTRQDPHQAHPNFNVDNGDAMQRLQNFYNLTLQRQAAGNCLPPRFGAVPQL